VGRPRLLILGITNRLTHRSSGRPSAAAQLIHVRCPGPMSHRFALAPAVLLLGCSHSPASAPVIEAEQFTLTIEATRSEASDAGRISIEHRLLNDSRAHVCVGGTQTFTIDEKVNQATVLRDALCRRPLLSVGPGETVTWTLPWAGGSGCWPNAPPAILETKPRLECGADVELRSRIWLFRLEGSAPQFGGTAVTSQPLTMRVMPGTWETTDGI
jgi:hypothetical protein